MSLRLFKGRTLTTLRAGLALNICSILVKGLMPLRALTAGFCTMMTFIRPGTTKRPGPFLPRAFLIWVERDSKTDATCLRDSWVSSAMPARISLLDGALAAVAAMYHYSCVKALADGHSRAVTTVSPATRAAPPWGLDLSVDRFTLRHGFRWKTWIVKSGRAKKGLFSSVARRGGGG